MEDLIMPRQLSRTRETAPDPELTPEDVQDIQQMQEEVVASSEEHRSRRDQAAENRSPVKRGFGAWKDRRAAKFGQRLTVKDKEVIIHFLEPEPFAVYGQHWVTTKEGRRTYTCLDDHCPLCDLGYDTRNVAVFNVVEMSTGSNHFWETGPDAVKAIQEYANDEGKWYSPIDKSDVYFAVNRSKKDNGFFTFKLQPIKARDLADDYSVDALTSEELADAQAHIFDDKVVSYQTRDFLRKLADELEDG